MSKISDFRKNFLANWQLKGILCKPWKNSTAKLTLVTNTTQICKIWYWNRVYHNLLCVVYEWITFLSDQFQLLMYMDTVGDQIVPSTNFWVMQVRKICITACQQFLVLIGSLNQCDKFINIQRCKTALDLSNVIA